MDWNKSNTILITAFIILNIFLFSSASNNVFSEEYNVVEDEIFIQDVNNLLSEKNITVNTKLPLESYILPTLDTEYEIVYVTEELLERFLGPGVTPVQDVYFYNNSKGEILEITHGKKLHFAVREKVNGKISDESLFVSKINEFIKKYEINSEGYTENYRYVKSDNSYVEYTKHYNNYSIDNSYMRFYFDKDGIYKFEMQNILTFKDTAEKIRTFSAAEALPRLMSYKDIDNKEIISADMTYYSDEDENWQYISGINSYPVWKVIFSDGSQKHLSSIYTYSIIE